MRQQASYRFDLPDNPPVDNFRQAFNTAIEEEIQRRLKADPVIKHTLSGGNFYCWQMDKIYNFEEMPSSRYERFCQFLAESAPVVEEGWYHLHAFYDKRASETYWKLVNIRHDNRVCKQEGRCRKISLVPW